MIVRFTKEDRSTFPYYFAHLFAYNMVALNLKLWKPHYLLHDFEKPWMLLWFKYIVRDKNPYKKVRRWHKTHRRHHVEFPKKRKHSDYIDMLIDWECSRLTKQQAQATAIETIQNLLIRDKINENEAYTLRCIANEIGLE